MDVYIERPEIYDKIHQVIKDRTHNRRLCILFGEFGIGKTTLLNKLEQDLENFLSIRLDLPKGMQMHPNTLKQVVIDFIKNSGVFFSKKAKNNDLKFRDKLSDIIKEFNLGVTLEMDSQGVITGGLTANFINPLIKVIENRHESYLKSANNASPEEFPIILARITKEISDACGNMLYIIIDDVDRLDYHVAHYLDQLLKSGLKIGLVISTEYDLKSLKNNFLMELIDEYFLLRQDTNDNFNYELSYFNLEETREYITKRFQAKENIGENIAKAVHEYTQGYPFILSLLCRDENNIQSVYKDDGILFKSNKYDFFYKRILDNLEPYEQEILFFLVCNQMHMHYDVLKKVMLKFITQNTFINLLERLLKEKHIEMVDKIIYIRHRMFSDYLNSSNKYLTELKKTENYSIIIEEYENLPDSKGEIEKYNSLTNLYLKVEEFDKAFNSVLHCSNLLINNKTPDRAVIFLSKIIAHLNFERFNVEQKSHIHFKLCYSYSLYKDMDNVITVFTSIKTEELNYMKCSSTYAELLLIVSKAYYYKNIPQDAIKYAELAIENNKQNVGDIYYSAMAIISSAYDLMGKYGNSFERYSIAVNEAKKNNDIIDLGKFKMIVQMVHPEFDTCIEFLTDAIKIFSEVRYDARNLACSFNNIGIEYLMNGNFIKSKEFLHKAESSFSSYISIESHFTDNNLGLYYMLSSEKDYDKALCYLIRAYENSISPLQHSYTSANRGILLFNLGKKDEASYWLNKALDFAKKCPDPIVSSYVMYNLALFNYKVGSKKEAISLLDKSMKGIEKDQLQILIIKRKHLRSLMEQKQYKLLQQIERTQRRSFFASCEWEPCELMFYN